MSPDQRAIWLAVMVPGVTEDTWDLLGDIVFNFAKKENAMDVTNLFSQACTDATANNILADYLYDIGEIAISNFVRCRYGSFKHKRVGTLLKEGLNLGGYFNVLAKTTKDPTTIFNLDVTYGTVRTRYKLTAEPFIAITFAPTHISLIINSISIPYSFAIPGDAYSFDTANMIARRKLFLRHMFFLGKTPTIVMP